MSSSDTNILGVLVEAFNAGAWDEARGVLGEELEFIDLASGVTTHGPDGFLDYARGWFGAFSNMRIKTLALVADDRFAAGEFLGGGIHDGPLPTPAGEVPPTGKTFEERFTWFADVSEGRITGLRDYYNPMSVMTQLELMPEPAEATS